MVLGLPKFFSVYSNRHDDSSGATEPRRQDRNHGNQPFHTAGGGVEEEERHSSQKMEGHTELIARRCQLSQEVAGRGPFGGTICPEQSDRNIIPTGTGGGEDVPDHETVGGKLGASRSMKTGQKKRLLGGNKKTKTQREKRNYRATRTSQYSASISVRLPHLMCMRFRGTQLPTCEEVPSCNTSVFWWQTVADRENPTSLSTDPPCSQVPGLSRCIHIATGIR